MPRACSGSLKVLSVLIMASSLVFMEFQSKRINVSLILIPSLGLYLLLVYLVQT